MPVPTNQPNNNTTNTTNGVITPPVVNSSPGTVDTPPVPREQITGTSSMSTNGSTFTQYNVNGQPYSSTSTKPKRKINKSPIRRNFYGEQAKTVEQGTPGYIDKRNRTDAETLRSQGATDATDYLKAQKGFLDSTPEEQQNTINNVNKMLNSPIPGAVVDEGASLAETQANQQNSGDDSFIGDMNGGGVKNAQNMKVIPGSSDRYFQGLMTNQQYDTNQQGTPAYKYAQRRSQKLRTIQAQTPQETAMSLVNNKLMRTGQGMRDLMQYDPERYKLIMEEFDKQNKLSIINSNVTSSTNPNTSQTTPLQDFDQETNDMIEELYGDDTAMKMKLRDELRNTPSIKAKADKLTELTGKKMKIDEMIFNSEEEARKQLGPEAPESVVQAYAARIGKDLQKQARTIDLDIMNAQAFLQNERDIATQRIADMDHIEQQNMQERQFKRGMYESDRAFGFQQQQFNASQYDKEWERNMQMNSPSNYKLTPDGNYFNMVTGNVINPKEFDNQVRMQEQQTMMLDTIQQARESGQASPYDIEIPPELIQKSGIGGQCVKYVNDLYERMGMGRPFAGADQSLAAKIRMTQGKLGSPTGVIGGTIVEDFGRKSDNGTNYGHLSMIIGMDDTGYRVTQSNGLLDSQGKGNGLINQRHIPYNSKSIKGFTVAPSVANSMGQQSSTSQDKYKKALDTILGSGKFTEAQQKQVINSIQSGSNPVSVIKNQAKSLMGDSMKTDTTKIEKARSKMLEIKDLMSQYYAAGGSTGYFKGNYEKTINKLGQMDDPKLVNIGARIAIALQSYRNSVSGTAYSVQEGVEIGSIFPGINKSQGLNTALIQARIDDFDGDIDSAYRGVLGDAYDDILQPEEDKYADF